jgi:hypothetical protein
MTRRTKDASVTSQKRRSATVRERFMKRISGNPRFLEAKKSGKAFVIVGTKP